MNHTLFIYLISVKIRSSTHIQRSAGTVCFIISDTAYITASLLARRQIIYKNGRRWNTKYWKLQYTRMEHNINDIVCCINVCFFWFFVFLCFLYKILLLNKISIYLADISSENLKL